jgi:anaerobic ribonucleoside-triphosphate reductase
MNLRSHYIITILKNMFTTIITREAKVVPFDINKVVAAIEKAGMATKSFGHDQAVTLAQQSVEYASSHFDEDSLRVEGMQDSVEYILLTSRFKKAAKAYILYRDQHAEMRAIANTASVDLVDNYLQKLDWQVNENSNMGYSLQGLNNYIFSEVSKTYWLHKIYPEEIRKANEEGDIHLHDLGTLSVYCVGWDLMDLLMEGFKGVSGKIESRPPKHFRTALGQVVNFMYTLQGEAAGAIAFSNFDTLLAPFIRYDKLTYKEVRQCVQEFVFNMNVPTRVGFQTPFSNITLDLSPSVNFKKMPVIIGGKQQKETYEDFQEEMNMLNTAFFEVMAEGDASGRVFTFPIPTVNITKDFQWDNPHFKGLWDITAKYGIPYFSNFVNSDMKPEDTRSMCCRLRLDLDELDKRGGGLFGANALTGSVGVVTINLPRIAYENKNKKDKIRSFLKQLGDKMDIAKGSLEIKRKMLERLTDANLYPYTKFYLRNIKEIHGEYWKNHFSTIGLVGMNEACLNLLGVSVGSTEGKNFAGEVLHYMRERLISYQKETGDLFNLEATPAEGTSYRLALKDKNKFPDIIVANEDRYQKGEEPFYTNSSQLPVNYTNDIFESLTLQDPLQTKYTGGTVIHLFLGERIEDSASVPSLVKKICENFKLPYFSLTPTFSVCPKHGYVSGEHLKCPSCNAACEVYSRIVGYLRPVSQWNNGKRSEFSIRTMYKI